VIGLGVIGLATALTAYGFGGSVVLFDVARSRRELAGRLLPGVAIIDPSALSGLREVVDVRHQRVSLVIDAAGGVPALRLACALSIQEVASCFFPCMRRRSERCSEGFSTKRSSQFWAQEMTRTIFQPRPGGHRFLAISRQFWSYSLREDQLRRHGDRSL